MSQCRASFGNNSVAWFCQKESGHVGPHYTKANWTDDIEGAHPDVEEASP